MKKLSPQVEDKDITKVKETQLVKCQEQFKQNNYWTWVINNSVAQGIELKSPEEIENLLNTLTKPTNNRSLKNI